MLNRILTCLICAALLLSVNSVVIAAGIGPDDRQLSNTGAPGTTATDAVSPAIAFDSNGGRYLVVWSADEVDGDFHVMGQMTTGASGTPLGPPFVISKSTNFSIDHRQPVVAFNPDDDQFLVVWSSDNLNPGAYEIMGQLVNADGTLVGLNRRYSDMGTNDTDGSFDAVTPDVAWHSDLAAFIVVWSGDDDTGLLTDGRFEAYGQLVDGTTGVETGDNDFRITYAGFDANGNDVLEPAVAVVPGGNRWIMAFEGDIDDDGIHSAEIWAYGGSADAPDSNGFPLSAMGGSVFDEYGANNPDLVHVPSSGEMVAVWDGVNGAGLPRAIYGQRFLPDGTLIGSLFPVSAGALSMGFSLREAIRPSIAVDPVTDDWFIAWQGDLDDGIPHHDHEIWAQRFNDVALAVEPAFLLSNMDPSGEPVAGAGAPAVAINESNGYKMIVWSGDLDTTTGGEHEIFAQAWSDERVAGTDDSPAAMRFTLHGAAPNPFNPETRIAFDLPAPASVSLRIYDSAGRLVRTLLSDEASPAGRNSVTWNGRDDRGRAAASGVYLYRIETPTDQVTRRMTLLK